MVNVLTLNPRRGLVEPPLHRQNSATIPNVAPKPPQHPKLSSNQDDTGSQHALRPATSVDDDLMLVEERRSPASSKISHRTQEPALSLSNQLDNENWNSRLAQPLSVRNAIALREKCGEDAVGFGPMFHAVADGVGGTATSSAPLAKALVTHVLNQIGLELERVGKPSLKAAQITKAFHRGASLARAECKGMGKLASTLNVAFMDCLQHEMHTLVVGDSKTVLIRDGKIAWESTSLTHEFNLPATVSTDLLIDQSKHSLVSTVKIQKGDICISCSDGISDNLFADEVLEVVNKSMSEPGATTQSVADALVDAARERATGSFVKTPFTAAAVKAYYERVAHFSDFAEANHQMLRLHLDRARSLLQIWEPEYRRSLAKELVRPNKYTHYKIPDLARLAVRPLGKLDDITVCVSIVS